MLNNGDFPRLHKKYVLRNTSKHKRDSKFTLFTVIISINNRT